MIISDYYNMCKEYSRIILGLFYEYCRILLGCFDNYSKIILDLIYDSCVIIHGLSMIIARLS